MILGSILATQNLNSYVCVCVCSVTSVLSDSPPGSSVLGTLQARILKWFVMFSARESSRPRNRTQVCASPAFPVDSSQLSHGGIPLDM